MTKRRVGKDPRPWAPSDLTALPLISVSFLVPTFRFSHASGRALPAFPFPKPRRSSSASCWVPSPLAPATRTHTTRSPSSCAPSSTAASPSASRPPTSWSAPLLQRYEEVQTQLPLPLNLTAVPSRTLAGDLGIDTLAFSSPRHLLPTGVADTVDIWFGKPANDRWLTPGALREEQGGRLRR